MWVKLTRWRKDASAMFGRVEHVRLVKLTRCLIDSSSSSLHTSILISLKSTSSFRYLRTVSSCVILRVFPRNKDCIRLNTLKWTKSSGSIRLHSNKLKCCKFVSFPNVPNSLVLTYHFLWYLMKWSFLMKIYLIRHRCSY